MSEQNPSIPLSPKKAKEQLSWEQETLQRLAFSALKEQQRARRWSIFFKILFFAYLITVLWLYSLDRASAPGISTPHTALIDIDGVITADLPASAENIKKGYKRPLKMSTLLELSCVLTALVAAQFKQAILTMKFTVYIKSTPKSPSMRLSPTSVPLADTILQWQQIKFMRIKQAS